MRRRAKVDSPGDNDERGLERLHVAVAELDARRRARNAFALAASLSLIAGLSLPALRASGADAGVVAVGAVACATFAGCALLARRTRGDLAAVLLNSGLALVLFAGVAVNRQIGPGPAFVAFSLFVAAATLPLPGVVIAGVAGALSVAGMWYVARAEPQRALPATEALTYGLVLCVVTTVLSIIQAINTKGTLSQLVQRENRAVEAETRTRALAAQLQQAQKMDALGRMAAAVAHDFNNLLTVIGNGIAVARRAMAKSGSSEAALIDAEQAASGARALTQRLLAFSRQGGTVSQVVDAKDALRGLTDLLPRALGPEIHLNVRLEGELPPIVAEPVQLEQILLNLALNARDAMPGGGTITVDARARDLAEGEEADCRPGQWLEVQVSDTGTGMSEEVLSHLFEPFFTTKPPGKGTGLGLSTCYGIARQLGGKIQATSSPGKGSTFVVLLPRAPV